MILGGASSEEAAPKLTENAAASIIVSLFFILLEISHENSPATVTDDFEAYHELLPTVAPNPPGSN